MSSIVKVLERRVAAFFEEKELKQTLSLAAAFSGGPDSTALLHLLSSISKKSEYSLSFESLFAVYVNHNLRSSNELRQELDIVQNTASSMGIKLQILSLPSGEIELISKSRGRGIEEAAREARYRVIHSWMQSEKVQVLVTAHTLDDQIETLIMRFFQGSGIEGMQGIPEEKQFIFRPLLGSTKAEILEYLHDTGLHYSIDSTNQENRFLRNRIRNIIPVIEKVFPGLYGSLLNFREKAELLSEHINSKNRHDYLSSMLAKDFDVVSFSLEDFRKLDRYERMCLLYEAWDLLRGNSQPVPYAVIRPLFTLAPKAQKRILEYDGTSMYTDGYRFFWTDHVVHSLKNKYLKVANGKEVSLVSDYFLYIREAFLPEEGEILLDPSKLSFPLVVRSALPGDYIYLAEGVKQLSKLFKDWKIFSDNRWIVPVIEDREEILAVMGGEFGGSNRIAKKMKNEFTSGKKGMALKVKYSGSCSGYAK
jgi:tRNA(Ile)-lysidine synthetase-like protein